MCSVSGSPWCRGEAAASAAPWNRLMLGLEPFWLPALFLKWSSICLLSTFGRNCSHLNDFTPVFAFTPLIVYDFSLSTLPQRITESSLTLQQDGQPCLANFRHGLQTPEPLGCEAAETRLTCGCVELLKGELSSPLLSCQAGSYSHSNMVKAKETVKHFTDVLQKVKQGNRNSSSGPRFLHFITNLCKFVCS